MSERPVLIGIIRLPIPRQLSRTEQTTEWIFDVAFDTQGRAWALVQTQFPLRQVTKSISVQKLVLSRWQRTRDIPFKWEPEIEPESGEMELDSLHNARSRSGNPWEDPDA